MLAKVTDADRLIQELDDQIAAERQSLLRFVEQSTARTAELMMRRARLKDVLREVSNVIVREASPAQDVRQERTGAKGNASSIMMTALAKAGADGLFGSEVNKAIQNRGLSVAAADKAKGRLKHALLVELGADRRWRLTEKGKKAIASAAK
jgi:hypothetical protein